MTSGQGEQGQQLAKPGMGKFGRWALLLAGLIVLGLLGWYAWTKYDDYVWQKMMDARKQADASLPQIDAAMLFDAYVKDKNAAISKYSGKRFFIGGRAFGAALLSGDELGVQSKPEGVVKFTVGSGHPDDLGNKYILLSAAHYWEIAYSSLSAGGLDMAACTVDPNKSGILTYGGDKYVYADDCSTLVTGLEKQSESPFANN
ncbi:MAG: hypothetical protein KGO02_16210 [Alphaproteobacteria bacterium]|nr:hypothetical protein [Alphaproteobacteria bacterium]